MFSRRTIQVILDQLGDALSEVELAEIVGRLNRPRERISATWETALLFGLSRTGRLSYHRPLPDGRKPDVTFTLPADSQFSFVADITTVSDAGHHEANPIGAFSDEFARTVRKAGLNPNHFHFQVESQAIGAKIKLALPKRAAHLAMLRKHLLPFLHELRSSGRPRHKLVLREPDLSMTISYDRQQRYMGSGYRMYTQARAIDQNPLWNSLRDKADQLRGAKGFTAGIIICDGGCSLLSGGLRGIGDFSADDIVREFLRQRSSVDFVYIVTVRRGYGTNAKCQFQGQGWMRDPLKKPVIDLVMNSALSNLPTPIFDAANAAMQAKQDHYGSSPRANLEYGVGKKIMYARISARTLLDILAGKLSSSEVDLAFGGSVEPDLPKLPNPFQRALNEGRMISKLELEPVEGKDDDWISIKFGDPDPAISPYRVRQVESNRGS